MTVLAGKRVGYVPYSPNLTPPGDRRRFVRYARRRGIEFELADPAKSYDVVVLSERADISVWRRYQGGRIVYDLIDSYLAIPRTNLKSGLRGLAKFVARHNRYLQLDYQRATQRMCQRADAVVCTTAEQARDISGYCRNVHTILDVHTMVAHTRKTDYAASNPFRIVWEGLPHTLPAFRTIVPVLEQVGRQRALELHLVTDPEYHPFLGTWFRSRTEDLVRRLVPGARLYVWDEATLADIICACDLAVIPLDLNDRFAAGKPENKLLLFWRLGMPVLASASPSYERAMRAAGQDGCCRTAGDWRTKLLEMIDDEALRRTAGEAGRKHAEEHYSEERILAAWDHVFESLR